MTKGTERMEIRERFYGWIGRAPSNCDAAVVVLAWTFPWSPAVLTSKVNLKIYVSSQSSVSNLAARYYSRFGNVELNMICSLAEIWGEIERAELIIDEGWRHSQPEVKKLLQLSPKKVIVRLASGFNVSTRKNVSDSGMRKIKAKHADLGGVTDAESCVFVWDPSDRIEVKDCFKVAYLPRDLRSILKCGIDGERSGKPSFVPAEAVNKVVVIRPGEVSAAGLFPLRNKGCLSKVRTKLGEKLWVTRDVVASEMFSIKDIPEPLFLLIRNDIRVESIARELFDSCRIPLKSLAVMLAEIVADPTGGRRLKPPLHTNRAETISEEVPQEELITVGELRDKESDCETSDELVTLLRGKLEEEKSENRSKTSDTDLPTETIWDIRVLPLCKWKDEEGRQVDWRRAFATIRKWILRLWKRSVVRSAVSYRGGLEIEALTYKTQDAIRDCLTRVADATIWGWDGGSRPFFWNWPKEWHERVKGGFPMWLRSDAINWKVAQPKPNARDLALMQLKIEDIRRKGYVQAGKARSFISFFGVPKGDSDIRMVYDGTKSGLNDALWAPGFPLPTALTHLRMVDKSSWMADNDAGEFFLNWVLDEKIQGLCGVDLTHFVGRTNTGTHVEIWKRCAMGLRTSPYVCVKGMLLAQEEILGDRHDPANVFRYDSVLLNLPGMRNYNAGKPMVSKIRKDGILAADVVCYVDDVRVAAPTEEECWQASQVVSKGLARLGLQDAARKRSAPSQSPGPWAGVVVTTDNDKVYISVSQKKWDRTREIVRHLGEAYGIKRIAHKTLERMTGYLVHVAQAYPAMKPYLNGLYATLNVWRPNRDKFGWKEKKDSRKRRKLNPGEEELDEDLEEDWQFRRFDLEEEYAEDGKEDDQEGPPITVQFIERAGRDIDALRELTSGEEPPLRMVRGNESVSMLYGFGDASGSGFGAAMQLADGTVYYQAGLWGEEFALAMSSNYRELRNLVDFVERAAEEGLLHGSQFMLFTDNLVADYAFHKGSSKSRLLHELVLKLRKLEMTLSAELLIVHVSGLRMIECGVDGISRGDLNAGLSAGQSIFDFIPLHLAAHERSECLIEWVRSWAGDDAELLTPDRWPEKHLSGGTYIWCPAPAAASAIVDFLGSSTHKRSTSIHIIVVPRMMTSQWKKNLGKLTDIQFGIPSMKRELGDLKDPNESIDALMPCLECGKVTSAVSGILCANYSHRRGGFEPCRGFWCPGCYCVPVEANRFPIKTGFDMGADGVINEEVRDRNRFLTARAGDHLMHEFQCDTCHYRNVKALDPDVNNNPKDRLFMECIRRCNLDELWSKEPTTVERNRRDIVKSIKLAEEMGIDSGCIFEAKEPRELKDNCAMGLAAVMILRSLDPGKNEKHVQFNTVRSMRAAYGNYWKASAKVQEVTVLMRGQTKLTSSTSPTNSIWFEGFMLGFHKRVGDVNRPDKAISIELMTAMMLQFEEQWKQAKGNRLDEKAVLFPALFSIVAYVASLRGEEVPLMDLSETRNKTLHGISHPTSPHVVITLIGRFKNEVGALKHHIPAVETTSSGLQIRVWLERMLTWYGPHESGYVFRDERNDKVSCGYYAQKILSVIRTIQQLHPHIVEKECDVFEEFGMSRSFRRGSDSRALAAGVNQATIDLINRWRTSDRVQGRTAHLKMSQHYADVRLLLQLYLPYSKAL